MFVFNLSIKKTKLKKIFAAVIIATIVILLLFFLSSLINKSRAIYVQDEIKQASIVNLTPENYTNILKSSYADIDTYVGKKIKFTGFVYRLYDFNESQFVLGREMIISKTSPTQAKVVVVGFLCTSKEATQFEDKSWVEIEGTIKKGFYHSEIPVVEVTSIKNTTPPEDPYVCPPDSSYVKTEQI